MRLSDAKRLARGVGRGVQMLPDDEALEVLELYPEWASGVEYPVGYKVRYGGALHRCRQAHSSIPGWEPANAASLWEQICETHTGAEDDPIPYEGNMALENGKHYIQGGVVYRCIRDTGNPVHHALADLVGVYVEIV